MKKPTIFLDHDGTKFDTLDAHLKYLNNKYGIVSIRSDYINNPSLDLVVNKHRPDETPYKGNEVYTDLIKNFLSSKEHHESILPFEGMIEVVPKLAEKYNLVVVTARPRNAIAIIEYMNEKYIPNCISDIHCVWYQNETQEFRQISKREYIRNYDGEKIAFIDDSAVEIKLVQDIIPSYLFDPEGWNDHDQTIRNRVKSWHEIADLFL